MCLLAEAGRLSGQPDSDLGCREALASTQLQTPRIPVISNVDAQPHSDPETIKDILARQVRVLCLSARPAGSAADSACAACS